MKIKDLPIGSIVYDDLSIWDFRSGDNYAEGTTFKKEPVRWIVYKHGHFSGNSTLLLSEELVANKRFNSSNYNNPWRTMEIRQWLRDIFWSHFTDRFKECVVECTTITRGEINADETVFLLSVPELGTATSSLTGLTGDHGETIDTFTTNEDRIAKLNGNAIEYWTRSPYSNLNYYVALIRDNGAAYVTNTTSYHATNSKGVRPALNINSDVGVIQKGENVFILDIHPRHLIRSNNKYYTYQNNEFIEVEPTVENFKEYYTSLSHLTTPAEKVILPMDGGDVLGNGRVFRKLIKTNKINNINILDK